MSRRFFRTSHDPLHVPEGGPNTSAAPSREIYAAMGEAAIKELLRDFYRELGASNIAGMFPKDLDAASEKSALFFIGLLGGPPVYLKTYGPPRLRARHLPFMITEEFRELWLGCFYKVLEQPERYQFPTEHLQGFKEFLVGFSGWMVNTAD